MQRYLTLFALVFFLGMYPVLAQFTEVESKINEFRDFMYRIFPIVLVVLFIAAFLYNIRFFIGDNAEWTKGVWRIVAFVVFVSIGVVIIGYIATITL